MSLRPAVAGMGWPVALLLLAIGCASGPSPRDLSPVDVSAVAPRSVRDGVYTVEQSRRGEAVFSSTCARCHKPEMTGGPIVPPLVGAPFLDHWSRKTAGDLYAWVRRYMPIGDAAAGMSRQDYADVLAYIFSRNGFPAGPEELAPDAGALRSIRFSPVPEESDQPDEPGG